MKTLAIELRKEKRTGVIPVLLAVGVLGAAYAFVNFIMRKDTLLNLPLAPMDVLLTQLYGMIMVLNLFGIVVATCMIYNMEFKGSAVKKMYMLPVSVPAMYLCKFLILTVMFLVAIVLQNLALAQIGMTDLPLTERKKEETSRKMQSADRYKKEIHAFLEQIKCDYLEVGMGEKNTLFKLKELWAYMGQNVPEAKKALKRIRKSQIGRASCRERV